MHGSASRQRGSIRAIPGEFWVLIFLSLSLGGRGPAAPEGARSRGRRAGVGRVDRLEVHKPSHQLQEVLLALRSV